MIEKLLFYYKSANSKGHGVHSPFVFQFITEVLNDERHFYAYDEIEHLYQTVLKKGETIVVNGTKETLDSYYKKELPLKYRRLLFRIVSYYKPSHIIEIGATTGITTAYLAAPDKDNNVISLACSNSLESAAIEKRKEPAIRTINISGSGSELLKLHLAKGKMTGQLFVIHLDCEEAELWLENMIAIAETDTVLLLIGINKNLRTKNVWTKIRNLTTITISIELFEMGLLFFRKEQLKKQQFAVRF